MKLITSSKFKNLKERDKAFVCNGTGSSGSPKWLVSLLDNFFGLGLNVREASNRHDCGYYFARTWIQKIKEDIIFFLNICILSINAFLVLPLSRSLGNLVFLPLRLLRAFVYFVAVLIFGWFAWQPNIGHKQRS